jgi:steroid 5-alpha reductase family enzyme
VSEFSASAPFFFHRLFISSSSKLKKRVLNWFLSSKCSLRLCEHFLRQGFAEFSDCKHRNLKSMKNDTRSLSEYQTLWFDR